MWSRLKKIETSHTGYLSLWISQLELTLDNLQYFSFFSFFFKLFKIKFASPFFLKTRCVNELYAHRYEAALKCTLHGCTLEYILYFKVSQMQPMP